MGMATKVDLRDIPAKKCPKCSGKSYPLFSGIKQKIEWHCIILSCGHIIRDE